MSEPTVIAVPPRLNGQVFPARPEQVREARSFLSRILAGCPAADDAILCLSELASNAVTHSNSAKAGGLFTVRASIRHDGRIRVEVEDQGGSWTRSADPGGHHGRGLLIVSQLASDWGIDGDGERGRIVWFETASLPGTQRGGALLTSGVGLGRRANRGQRLMSRGSAAGGPPSSSTVIREDRAVGETCPD